MPPEKDRDRTGPGPPGNSVTGDNHGTVIQVGTVYGGVGVGAGPPHRHRVPRQIPHTPRFFTDRERESRLLDSVGRQAREGGGGRVVVLSGTGGVGKTALATHFLEENAGAFPDGALYADLQGFGEPGPADTGDVLDGFLRALHVDPGAIPHDTGARAAAFRSRTHGLGISVLLDNALSAAQVRALLPGRGPHLVVVTSRLHLAGLRLDGAELLEVRPLDEPEAVRLVSLMLSDGRTGAEPASARELVDLCGRLPLALRAAVSGLTDRPHQPLSRLVSRLSGEHGRLAALSQTRELSVDTAFNASYALLSEPARRMYRLLGLAPGRDLTPEAAAALAGVPDDDAEDLLTDLVAASLLEEGADGRLRQHDLARLHARSLAEEGCGEGSEREAAVDRVLDFYLETSAAADRTLNPGRWHLAPVFDRPPRRVFGSRAEALDWLEAELECLRACVRLAHGTGRHSVCWQLCEALRNLFMLRKHYTAWEEAYTTGLASAEAIDDPAAQAYLLSVLAALQRTLGRLDQAGDSYHRALPLWRRADHVVGRTAALEGYGVLELDRGRPRKALDCFREALRIYQEIGMERGIVLVHRRLGQAASAMGDHEASVRYFTRALKDLPESTEAYMRLRALVGLASAYISAGRFPDAVPVLEEALGLSRDLRAETEEARVRVMFADAARESGQFGEARRQLTRALSIYTSLSAPQTEETRRGLDALRQLEES
ncbi:tetratricopeptide repeat protein [Nocardiopsis tropica]|uniref:Tetratricopeptide repeat protein n=1 Tax=Nocardiopsis tropica TaxID=109330 RepID=A0ABV1ZTU5_9ACTN